MSSKKKNPVVYEGTFEDRAHDIIQKEMTPHREWLEELPETLMRGLPLYRTLGDRMRVNPIFLYRNLSYMKHRMSRNNKSRKGFQVNLMLEKKNDSNDVPPIKKYLTITYLGFYHTTYDPKTVKVETFILKSQHRRKFLRASTIQLSVGVSEVPVNPSPDTDLQVPVVSIGNETLNGSNYFSKHRYLLIRVMFEGDNKENTFEVKYAVFNQKGECILEPGDYEASPGINEEVWTRLEAAQGYVTDTVKSPKISFKLEWTDKEMSGWVQKPSVNAVKLVATGDPKVETILDVDEEIAHIKNKEDKKITLVFSEGNVRLISEIYNVMLCPFCCLNCRYEYSLFKHLRATHDYYQFQFERKKNEVVITIIKNEKSDRSYEGNPYNLVGIYRRTVMRRLSHTSVLVYQRNKRGRKQNDLDEFFKPIDSNYDIGFHRPFVTGHDRLYFNTSTTLPLLPCETEIDPENEKDPMWLRQKICMMIDDFTDVNSGEKAIMKEWNLFVLKHGFVGDCQIPLACHMFSSSFDSDSVVNLYRNFCFHIANMHDFSLLSSVDVYEVLTKLLKKMHNNTDLLEKTRAAVRMQKQKWEESGGSGGPRDKANAEVPDTAYPSSSFITEDGTLRRKMHGRKPNRETSSPSAPKGEENGEVIERGRRKRKLSLEKNGNDTPAKRTRCGSDPVPSSADNNSTSQLPTRRKSTQIGNKVKHSSKH